MAKLLPIQQRFIVQRLACYDSPSIVAEAVKEAFGIEVSRQQVMNYDPDSGAPSAKWRQVFKETRAQFLNSTASIAIAQKSVRLLALDRLFVNVTTGARKNVVLALDILERAAKEMGEAYTNKRVIEAGDPLESLAKLLGIPPDDIQAALAGIAAGAE